MRDILFRGKSVNTSEWVEGYLVITTIEPVDDTPIKHYHIENMTIGAFPNEFQSGLSETVNPETVGQFTGLTDKNGKKIFEGDIVDCWSEGVNAQGTVQQRKDGLWIIYPAWQKQIMWGLCPDEYGNTTVKVIGNIHDNPELMEVTDNA